MNMIEKIEQEQMAQLTEGKNIPEFAPGDTVKVNVKVVEGSRERIQAYEGVVIARSNRALNSSFTVRKISYGEVWSVYSHFIHQTLTALKLFVVVVFAVRNYIIFVVCVVRKPVLLRKRIIIRSLRIKT